MAGDAVHGTRILSFWTLILSFRTLILFFTNTNFIFFEHELNESWCLRNIILARIKRIFMDGTGTRNWSKGSHTDLAVLTDFLMQWRNDEMKRWWRDGDEGEDGDKGEDGDEDREIEKRGVIFEKRTDFSWENRWIFYAQKWIFMQNKRNKCINIQNNGCKQNKGFCLLFSKISRVLFTVFVNNS